MGKVASAVMTFRSACNSASSRSRSKTELTSIWSDVSGIFVRSYHSITSPLLLGSQGQPTYYQACLLRTLRRLVHLFLALIRLASPTYLSLLSRSFRPFPLNLKSCNFFPSKLNNIHSFVLHPVPVQTFTDCTWIYPSHSFGHQLFTVLLSVHSNIVFLTSHGTISHASLNDSFPSSGRFSINRARKGKFGLRTGSTKSG